MRCRFCGAPLVVHRGQLVCSHCGLVYDVVYAPGISHFEHLAPVDLTARYGNYISRLANEFGDKAVIYAKMCVRQYRSVSIADIYYALRYLVLKDADVNPRLLPYHALVCARGIAERLGYKLSRIDDIVSSVRELLEEHNLPLSLEELKKFIEENIYVASGFSSKNAGKLFICLYMLLSGRGECPWRDFYKRALKMKPSLQ